MNCSLPNSAEKKNGKVYYNFSSISCRCSGYRGLLIIRSVWLIILCCSAGSLMLSIVMSTRLLLWTVRLCEEPRQKCSDTKSRGNLYRWLWKFQGKFERSWWSSGITEAEVEKILGSEKQHLRNSPRVFSWILWGSPANSRELRELHIATVYQSQLHLPTMLRTTGTSRRLSQ